MFTDITWTNYIIVIILLLVIYYISIGIRFYYRELKNLAGKQGLQLFTGYHGHSGEKPNNENERSISEPSGEQGSFGEPSEEAFQEVEHLIGRLKETIEGASRKKQIKEDLFRYLKSMLKEYPELKNSQFRPAISELIASECAKYGPYMLRGDDAAMLWDGV